MTSSLGSLRPYYDPLVQCEKPIAYLGRKWSSYGTICMIFSKV